MDFANKYDLVKKYREVKSLSNHMKFAQNGDQSIIEKNDTIYNRGKQSSARTNKSNHPLLQNNNNNNNTYLFGDRTLFGIIVCAFASATFYSIQRHTNR